MLTGLPRLELCHGLGLLEGIARAAGLAYERGVNISVLK